MLTNDQIQELCDMAFDEESSLLFDVIKALNIDAGDYTDGDDEKACRLAVALELDCNPADCTINGQGAWGYGYTVNAEGQELSVMTDDEADSAWDASLESYLDDGCVEGADSPYFDRERWKADARHDGRGHCLSCYDGDEREQKVGDTYLYLYRTN